MKNNKLKRYKRWLGQSMVIGAILANTSAVSVNAVETDETDGIILQEEVYDAKEDAQDYDLKEPKTEQEQEKDIIQVLRETQETLHTHEETEEREAVEKHFIELIDQAIERALEYQTESRNEEAIEIFSFILELESLPVEYEIKINEYRSVDEQENEIVETSSTEEDSSSDDTVLENEKEVTEQENTSSEDLDKQTGNSNSETEKNDNQMVFRAQADSKVSIRSADDYYEAAINAPYASQAWENALEGNKLYPNDERFIDAIGLAADRMLTIGTNSHLNGNYERALEYYNQLLGVSEVPSQIRTKAELYKTQAESNEVLKTADDYYGTAMTAPYASQAWDAAVRGRDLFPEDGRFVDAIAEAAERMLIIGMNSHQSSNTERALEYYNELLQTPDVPFHIVDQVGRYAALADAGQRLKTSDEYYEEALNAPYASQAWDAAVRGRELFPEDGRFVDAIAEAAERMLTIGMNSHQSSNTERALEYYNELLQTPDVPFHIVDQVGRYAALADAGQRLKTSDEYYEEALNAPYASQAWQAAIEGQGMYPQEERFLNAIAQAGNRILIIGIDSHKEGNVTRASEYYQTLIKTPGVPSELVDKAAMLKSYSDKGNRLRTANEYYVDTVDAYYASQAWELATEGYVIYPSDNNLVKAINHAANRIMSLAINSHRNEQFETAVGYYDSIIGHEAVSAEMREQARLFNEYASKNRRIRSEKEYTADIKQAPYASQAWMLAEEAAFLYPESKIVREGLVVAADRQIEQGRRYQENGNPSRAKPYFDRVANLSALPESKRVLAASYSRLTQPGYKPVVYIDPGHGGHDSGAYFGGVREADLNLSTAKYLQEELISRGYDVIMSRESDVFLSLAERTEHANSVDTDVFISIHYNSMGGSGSARGIETFIYHRVPSGFGQERNRENFETENPRIEDSLRLADATHNELIRQTGLNQRYVKGNNFHVVRETYLPAILFELGFLDNPAERAHVRQKSYHRTAARAIADGVDAYFER